jgi:hypothetical protein
MLQKFSAQAKDYKPYRGKLVSCAFNATSTNKFGFVGLILTPEAYAKYTAPINGGVAALPFALIPEQLPFADCDLLFADWKYQDEKILRQTTDLKLFRKTFLDSIDLNTENHFQDEDYHLDNANLTEVLAYMDETYGTVMGNAVDQNKIEMTKHFTNDGSMELSTFIGNQEVAHKFAEKNFDPIGQYTKYATLRDSVSSCGAFKDCLRDFVAANRVPEKQTFEKLKKDLLDFAATTDLLSTTGKSHYANSAVLTEIETLKQMVTQQQAAIAALTFSAAAVTKQSAAEPKQQNGKKNTSSADQKKKGRKQKCYCHSHGPNNSHNGDDCNDPIEPGHEPSATYENMMGGARFFTRSRDRK